MSEPVITEVVEKLSFTVVDAAKATGISRSALYEDLKAGLLRGRKRNGTTLILRQDLAEYLANLPDWKAENHR